MKKYLLLFLLCSQFSWSSPLQEKEPSHQAIIDLASSLHIDSTKDIIEETQKFWLRKKGNERWQVEELDPQTQSFVIDWADDHGLLKEKRPTLKQYDTALILGSTIPNMKQRLLHLIALWEEGIRFQEIVWLTGERPLDKNIEKDFLDCETESEGAKKLWSETSLPQAMKTLPVIFIASPCKGIEKIRPTTYDTLLSWLTTSPSGNLFLFISSQPYCNYQKEVIEGALPSDFSFDVAGAEAVNIKNSPGSGALILDTLARQLYQRRNNLEKNFDR